MIELKHKWSLVVPQIVDILYRDLYRYFGIMTPYGETNRKNWYYL